jgi:hypothetical protein
MVIQLTLKLKFQLAICHSNNGTFDVIVRDFFDTDSNRYSFREIYKLYNEFKENNFIGKKIGSV